MVHKPQGMALAYEAVHEAQAQNTDDIMSANTDTLENDMDNIYRTRINLYNHCPCRKPTYNKLCLYTVSHESRDELLHYMLTHHSVKNISKCFEKQSLLLLLMN